MPSKKLLLIDGSSYFYRAFHALPPLKNSKGQATGAIYGVVNMIQRLILNETPDHIGVIFDAKGPTFRHELYKDYKAHRSAMPDELVSQIKPLHEIIVALGLPLICVQGIEADDVLATLAKQAEAKECTVVISTGDKDLAQLVNDHITLINTMSNTRYDREGVIKKFGIPPEKIIDYLALVGDASDNIPGIAGCGPKTALKWLSEFGAVDEIIQHANEIAGKVGETLRNSIELLKLSKQLVTLQLDVPLELKFDELVKTKKSTDALKKLYAELEFNKWLQELIIPLQRRGGGAADGVVETFLPSSALLAPSPETGEGINKISTTPPYGHPSSGGELKNYELILDQQTFDTYLEKLKVAPLFAFDLETTSLNSIDAQIVGISFAMQDHHAVYIPLAHSYLGAPIQLNREKILAELKPLLENPLPQKIGQHLKYDMNVLAHYDIQVQGIASDTLLESYVYNSTVTRHDLLSLAKLYLNIEGISFESVAGSGKHQLTFDQVDLDTALNYAAEDSDLTLQLHQVLLAKLQATPRLVSLLNEIEIPLIPVLSKIECTGVLIDSQKLAQLSLQFGDKMKTLQAEIFQLAGQEFNIDSPKQLQTILFDQLGLPVLKKTPKGQPSTAEPILQELAENYPLPALIMEYRTATKLKSTYTDKLPTLVNARTGRVHTSYQQAVTSTGRLSSSDPNLQNIPIRREEGRAIRQAFIAAPGYSLISADYSQVELRIMAHLSEDTRLIEAFLKGEDIHRATAADVFGVSLLEVTAEQRRHAKAINFGLLYGMSAFGLAKQLKVSRSEAQHYIELYFERYPGVKKYMDDIRQLAREQGYVETLSGRRLYLPGIHDRNKMLQQAAERAAINAPMQGTAADLIKIAMINLDRTISKLGLDAKMIMQVHDELVVEVLDAHIENVTVAMRDAMSQAMQLRVPLVVDVSIGKNWDA